MVIIDISVVVISFKSLMQYDIINCIYICLKEDKDRPFIYREGCPI